MESNSFNTIFKTGIIGFTSECYAIIFDLRWMILLAFVLILSDFWFGISVSRMQGIEVRKSRAGRKTLNKVIDYLCYVLLGAVIGKAIGDPYGLNPITVSITIMILCYCFEIDSIYNHICELHGVKKRYSIWAILWKLITFKFKDVGEAFQDMRNQSKDFKNNKNEDTV
jgi:hypothetical protein